MIRATYGVTASTSVSTGSTIASMSSQGRAPGAIRVTAGSVPGKTVVAKSTTEPQPITNSGRPRGRACPSERGDVEAAVARAAPHRRRARSTSGIEISRRRRRPGRPELTMRSCRRSDRLLGGERGAQVAVQEPGQPVQYCWKTGWSRCSCSRRALRLAGVACGRGSRARDRRQRLRGREHDHRDDEQHEQAEQTRRDEEPPAGDAARLGRAAAGGPAA